MSSFELVAINKIQFFKCNRHPGKSRRPLGMPTRGTNPPLSTAVQTHLDAYRQSVLSSENHIEVIVVEMPEVGASCFRRGGAKVIVCVS